MQILFSRLNITFNQIWLLKTHHQSRGRCPILYLFRGLCERQGRFLGVKYVRLHFAEILSDLTLRNRLYRLFYKISLILYP